MRNKQLTFLLFTAYFVFNTTTLMSQGWERIYFDQAGGNIEYSSSYAAHTFLQDDGSFLFSTNIAGQPNFLWTDENGYITNQLAIPNENVIKTADQNYVFARRTDGLAPANQDVYVSKFDEMGNSIWTYYPEGYVDGNETVTDIIQNTNNDYVFVGTRGDLATHQVYPYISKINENGDLIWKTVGEVLPEDNIYGYRLLQTPDGEYFMIASSVWFTPNNPIITVAIKIDQNGNILWTSNLDTDLRVESIVLAPDGNIVLLGQKSDYSFSLLKIDANANTIWEQALPSGSSVLIATSDQGFAFIGSTYNEGENFDIQLIKTDQNGLLEWQQTYGGAFRDHGHGLKQTLDGGYMITGAANGQNENQSLYLIKTDELGNSISSLIHGNVQYDLSENCLLEADEQALEDWIVSAAGNTGTFYGAVDENGYYNIDVDADTYEVGLTIPNEYWNACDNNIMTTVTDTSIIDFAVQSVDQCPLMEVSIHNYGFRLCEPATINILCQNQGTQLAEGVYVEIALDDSLQLLNASVPYTLIANNTYSFEVGDIDFLDENSFLIEVEVGCHIELMGQSLCVEAIIFPNTSCLPVDPLWSGASVQVSANCEDDEVIFKIENVGTEDMPQALQYTVIEDHVIMLQGQTYGPLAIGESISIPKIANGSFYRIESNQVANHPGMSMPSAFMEACGTGENGEISLGFVNQYTLNDADFFLDLSCTEVLAAFDPNAKQAFPIGYDNEHFIEANTRIDYVIQFQNTGTAEARNVVLMDHLSANLDPASILPGVSSHSYDFELLGKGIVRFTFKDIQLPDSTNNEAASHGYVKFSINQQKDLAVSTVINNTAAIYFDHNPAILTNTTHHTIGENFVTVNVGDILKASVSVNVYPNPFMLSATIDVKSDNNLEALTIHLFDVSGKEVLNDQFSSSSYQLSAANLAKGTYFYQIKSRGQLLNVGKVIVQ